MELNARDIQEKQFHDAWRGYNQEEVDDFLDHVAEQVELATREIHALRRRVEELDQAVAASRSTEEMLKKTLVTAQRAAEDAIATAKGKAEQLIAEAEQRARSAEQEAARRQAATEQAHAQRKQQLEGDLDRLRAFERDLRQRLSGFLDQQRRTLDELGRTRPGPTPASEAPAPQQTAGQGPPGQGPAGQGPAGQGPAGDRPLAQVARRLQDDEPHAGEGGML